MTTPFQFPKRNPSFQKDHEILFINGFAPETEEYGAMYERSHGDEAKKWRFQYLVIEEELERALRYVDPCDENANVFSLKFAEIIRSASNAYEIMMRDLYSKLFINNNKINICDYLVVEKHLNLAPKRIRHLAAQGTFPNHLEVCQPFMALSSWDMVSRIKPENIPKWWTGYNRIKHSNDGIKTYATLANALAATAALFLLIERVFGCRVLQGGFLTIPATTQRQSSFKSLPAWARLFMDE